MGREYMISVLSYLFFGFIWTKKYFLRRRNKKQSREPDNNKKTQNYRVCLIVIYNVLVVNLSFLVKCWRPQKHKLFYPLILQSKDPSVFQIFTVLLVGILWYLIFLKQNIVKTVRVRKRPFLKCNPTVHTFYGAPLYNILLSWWPRNCPYLSLRDELSQDPFQQGLND